MLNCVGKSGLVQLFCLVCKYSEQHALWSCGLSPANSSPNIIEHFPPMCLDPPIFTIQPTSNIIRDFGTARLHCAAIGNPEPEVSWFLNGNPVHSPSQVANNDLVIWNVEMNDQGIYQCFVSNTAGQAHSSALLLVDVPGNYTVIEIFFMVCSSLPFHWKSTVGYQVNCLPVFIAFGSYTVIEDDQSLLIETLSYHWFFSE